MGPLRCSSLLLLCTILVSRQVVDSTDHAERSKLDHGVGETKVTRESSGPGFERAATDEDMAPLFRENLDPDFAHWKGKQLTLQEHLFGMHRLMDRQTVGVVIIQKNVIYVYRNKSAHGYTVVRLRSMQRHMMRAVRDNGIVFPDTFFFYNLVDQPPCHAILEKECSAPVFTVYKQWDYSSNSNSVDSEIAFPHFGRAFGYLYNYPWEEKDPRAMLRARFQSSMESNSTRLLISERAAKDPEAEGVLDAGIVENRNSDVNISVDAQKEFVWIQNHARWKFLINTNGHVCSSRLGQLFQMNSLVLNEPTDWIEYYYRSIKPGVHFIPLDAGGIVQQVKNLQDPSQDARVREIANNSQHFGFRYLGHLSKVLYVRETILRYNALFSEMSDFMRHLHLSPPKADLSERRPTPASMSPQSFGMILEDDDYVGVEPARNTKSIPLRIKKAMEAVEREKLLHAR